MKTSPFLVRSLACVATFVLLLSGAAADPWDQNDEDHPPSSIHDPKPRLPLLSLVRQQPEPGSNETESKARERLEAILSPLFSLSRRFDDDTDRAELHDTRRKGAEPEPCEDGKYLRYEGAKPKYSEDGKYFHSRRAKPELSEDGKDLHSTAAKPGHSEGGKHLNSKGAEPEHSVDGKHLSAKGAKPVRPQIANPERFKSGKTQQNETATSLRPNSQTDPPSNPRHDDENDGKNDRTSAAWKQQQQQLAEEELIVPQKASQQGIPKPLFRSPQDQLLQQIREPRAMSIGGNSSQSGPAAAVAAVSQSKRKTRSLSNRSSSSNSNDTTSYARRGRGRQVVTGPVASSATDVNQTDVWDESCARHSIMISFADIGWDIWVIAPSSFESFYCSGTCDRHSLGEEGGSSFDQQADSRRDQECQTAGLGPSPCCRPRSVSPLNITYRDDHGALINGSIPDLIVNSCGCR